MTPRMAPGTGAARGKAQPIIALRHDDSTGDRYAKRFRLRRGAPVRIDPHGGGDTPPPCHELITPPGRCPPMVGLHRFAVAGLAVVRITADSHPIHDAQSFQIWRLAWRSTIRPIAE